MEPRLNYEETMALGQAQYQEVIDQLNASGLPTVFTQTGGMNAALEVMLDGGYTLLVTDAEDSLSWSRVEQQGWGVGLYAPADQYDGECVAAATADDQDVASLMAVIDKVLRTAARRA